MYLSINGVNCGGFTVHGIVDSVSGMIPRTALNGVSGQEEVIKLFIVTDGAECVMPSAHLEEPAVFRTKAPETQPEGSFRHQVDTSDMSR